MMHNRMLKRYIWILILTLTLVGCVRSSSKTLTPTINTTPSLAPVGVNITKVPDAATTARAFLDAWKAGNYSGMYQYLTKISQDAISEEDLPNIIGGLHPKQL